MLSIKQRQLNLYHCGYYYTGSIDGLEGPLTKGAYGKFQEAKGLVVDKIYGPKTEAALLEETKLLQSKLNSHGATLVVDGLVGDLTIAAIKSFQKVKNLVVDGIAGEKTWEKLNGEGELSWNQVKYFKREEFKCGCGGRYCSGYPQEMDMRLVSMLDKMRSDFGVPITVTSGVRCREYNKEVGGVTNSKHLEGMAADIYVPRVSLSMVKERAYSLGAAYSYYGTPGMGNAVHVDV